MKRLFLPLIVALVLLFVVSTIFQAPSDNTNFLQPTDNLSQEKVSGSVDNIRDTDKKNPPKVLRYSQPFSYTEFLDNVRSGRVKKVTMKENSQGMIVEHKVNTNNNIVSYRVIAPEDDDLVAILEKNGVIIEVQEDHKGNPWISTILFYVVIILLFWWIMRRISGNMMGGGSGKQNPFSFGKSKAVRVEISNIKFDDVAGIDEAKEEVTEFVHFLTDPSKFRRLGGRIPRGILMTGPAGTGKTLLAKAIAGEAGVPFFSTSGSDFVEMFVGVGASRVRDMFEQARKDAPCIIFIDEIDAVGRQRGAGLGGGHDEREQTLNQLLVEMDGFTTDSNVIMIAATNRPDILDPALLRPGRFDRQVAIPLPDLYGREKILQIHAKNYPHWDDDVNFLSIARGTPGMSGADLANLLNEAALFATRQGKDSISSDDLEKAKDKIYMGVERSTKVMTKEDLLNTAYHETGHTMVALRVKYADPVHKLTIIPRGRALGVTMQLPERDQFCYRKEYIEDRIAVLMGGRIAEELFMGQMTTGASNDFEQAMELANNMVTKWGMSEEIGCSIYSEGNNQVFLGKEMGSQQKISEDTLLRIDKAKEEIINAQYSRAKKIIEDNKEDIENITKSLMAWETLKMSQLQEILKTKKPLTPPTKEDLEINEEEEDENIDIKKESPPIGGEGEKAT